MSVNAVKKFYNLTLNNAFLQKSLMKMSTVDDFIDLSVTLGEKYGCIFSKSEMKETMSGLDGSEVFSEVDFGNDWIKKVIEIGWVPLGYTR